MEAEKKAALCYFRHCSGSWRLSRAHVALAAVSPGSVMMALKASTLFGRCRELGGDGGVVRMKACYCKVQLKKNLWYALYVFFLNSMTLSLSTQ